MNALVFKVLKDLLLSVLGKIAFKIVAERFLTRLIIYSLEKLKDYSTNDVIDDTVQDIINQLRGKKLAVVDKELPSEIK